MCRFWAHSHTKARTAQTQPLTQSIKICICMRTHPHIAYDYTSHRFNWYVMETLAVYLYLKRWDSTAAQCQNQKLRTNRVNGYIYWIYRFIPSTLSCIYISLWNIHIQTYNKTTTDNGHSIRIILCTRSTMSSVGCRVLCWTVVHGWVKRTISRHLLYYRKVYYTTVFINDDDYDFFT